MWILFKENQYILIYDGIDQLFACFGITFSTFEGKYWFKWKRI